MKMKRYKLVLNVKKIQLEFYTIDGVISDTGSFFKYFDNSFNKKVSK